MTTPRNARTTNRGRQYQWQRETFDSVTTILSGGIPKPALTNWAAKSVAEFVADNLEQVNAIAGKDTAAAIDLMKGSPWRTRDKAANLGSRLHNAAEAHVLGTPIPDASPDEAPYMEHFVAFLDEWQPTYHLTEATVYSRKYGYAGTLDAIFSVDGYHGGALVLCDYKTGKGVYGEVALQLAAYRYAEFIGLPDGTEVPVPPVAACAVLHLTPSGYELVPVEAGEAEFRYFLYAQQIRIFCNDVAGDVIGAPLPRPAGVAS